MIDRLVAFPVSVLETDAQHKRFDDAPKIMLKTSPILSNSPSVSPSGHRNAPSRCPPDSPLSSAVKQRRPSSWPAPPPSSSPLNMTIKQSAQPAANSTDISNLSDTSMRSAAFASPNPTPPLGHSPKQPLPSPPRTLANGPDNADASRDDMSPNKRRVSPEQHSAQAEQTESTSASPSQQSLQTAKRPRRDEQPPKILSRRYELCAVEDMVELIAHMLAELIATNDAIRISNGGLTRFHSRTPPGISVRDYLHRLARHATLTPPLLLAMVYYIDRLCALYQEFTINTLTVHRFLITAATVAAKGLSDSFWNNTTYARVGGVRVAELKLLELEFLYRVDWKIVPNPEILIEYYQGLVERTPGYALEASGTSEDEYPGADDINGQE